MPKKQRRKKALLKQRLRDEFPRIHAELKAGIHGSVTEAAIAAGLKQPRSALETLQRAWDGAAEADQALFLERLVQEGRMAPPDTASMSISNGRYLQPEAVARIRQTMMRRKLSVADVAREIGLERQDPSLGMALRRGFPLRLKVIAALDAWLHQQDTA